MYVTSCSNSAPDEVAAHTNVNQDDRYIAVVRDVAGAAASSQTDDELIMLANMICGMMDGGIAYDEVVSNFRNDPTASDSDLMLVGAVIGAGVPAYCPEHQPS